MNEADMPNQVVAEFQTHTLAEQAIDRLTKANIDVHNLSIVGQDYHTEEQPVGYVNTGDRMLTWGKFGAFWGSIWGLLFGSAVLFVPGGAILVAGWLAIALAGAVEGAVIGGGLAALGAAFASIGLPKDSIMAYQTAIKAGNFLVIVRGTADEVANASSILESLNPKSLNSHDNRQVVNA